MKLPIQLYPLSIALLLVAGPACAADFPHGSYTAGTKVTISFDDKGQFQVHEGDELKVAGSYTVKKDHIQLTDKEGPWACTNTGEQTGSYTWKYANSALAFSKVTDGCSARVDSLVKSSWKKAT